MREKDMREHSPTPRAMLDSPPLGCQVIVYQHCAVNARVTVYEQVGKAGHRELCLNSNSTDYNHFTHLPEASVSSLSPRPLLPRVETVNRRTRGHPRLDASADLITHALEDSSDL